MNDAIKIKNLSVTLGGEVKALRNISISLPAGKKIGIIGPSGAGKTTLIKCIVGRQKLTSGIVEIFGEVAGSAKLRPRITYMTQDLSVYPDLTVKENLEYFSTMSGQTRKQTKETIKKILTTIELTDKGDSLVGSLSGGQKQRASLAIALIGSPSVMVLDEPTVGLDPVLREKFWNLFTKLAGHGTTLVISSHSMDEAQRCDDLVLLRDGKAIAHTPPEELIKSTGSKTVEESFLKLVRDK